MEIYLSICDTDHDLQSLTKRPGGVCDSVKLKKYLIDSGPLVSY